MGKMNELSLVHQRVNELTVEFWNMTDAEMEAARREYREQLQPALLAAYGPNASCDRFPPLEETKNEEFNLSAEGADDYMMELAMDHAEVYGVSVMTEAMRFMGSR